MPIEIVIGSLRELISIHELFIDLSRRKTKLVKSGSTDKFQKLLNEERKLIQMLEKAEQNRQQVVVQWFEKQGLPLENLTITNILNKLENNEARDNLEKATIELTKLLTKLKLQEQLNHDLIRQSMQFVRLSLDMMQPTIKNINYGDRNTEGSKRSVFDSQA